MAGNVKMPDPGLLALAQRVAEQTASLNNYLESQGHPPPSFAPDAAEPPDTAEYLALHSSLASSLDDLQRLIDGPRRSLRTFVMLANDLAAFQVAFDFGLFQRVPLDGELGLQALAEQTGMDTDRLLRTLRMLITHRVFREPRPTHFSHTAASALFHSDEELRAAAHYMLDECFKAATSASDCIRNAPQASDSLRSPFFTQFHMPMFAYYEQHPQYAARFAKAMAGVTKVDRQIAELRDRFPWDQIEGTVVDVGGGSGHVSMSLAETFSHLRFLVQDASDKMLAEGQARDLTRLGGRIRFMKHSFFDAQPELAGEGRVGAYLIRQCTHNWCDGDVVRILKSFVPALERCRPGTPLLINDTVLPEPGTVPLHEERALRQMDMLMFVVLGAKQRSARDFEALLREADPRYEIHRIYGDGSMGLVEVHLKA